jgi:ATP-dependent Clp protease ATP-binding subunit ClpC
VVLLDEIEKAHPDVFNILLQMLEEGRLTDAQGRHVDFKNTIVIMTSNIGAASIAKNSTLGFGVEEEETGVSYEDMKGRIMGELKKVFRPELLNRIDEVIVFHKLSKEEIKSIVDQLMKRLREQMKVHEVSIELTDSAKDMMVERGYDPTMGARPLRRAIQRFIEDPLADFVLARNIKPGSTVLVDHVEGDDEVSLQMIEPVDVPDAPPVDLVPAEGPADEPGDPDEPSDAAEPDAE